MASFLFTLNVVDNVQITIVTYVWGTLFSWPLDSFTSCLHLLLSFKHKLQVIQKLYKYLINEINNNLRIYFGIYHFVYKS